MARAELARRIAVLQDLELAMLRAHAGAPIAGPALLATAPLETVGRLSVGSGEIGDEHGAVVRMVRAELTRRILALPDLELAMLRAHAGAPIVGSARAELLRRHPQLTPMTNESIKWAVEDFCEEDGGKDDEGDEIADFRHSPESKAKHGPVGLWDVWEVTSMDHLFAGCKNFNEDVSAWDVRRAENMCDMFGGAESNQPLAAWNMRRAEDLSYMAEDLSYMFAQASSFNQPLAAWDVRRVTDFTSMVCFPGGAPDLCLRSLCSRANEDAAR